MRIPTFLSWRYVALSAGLFLTLAISIWLWSRPPPPEPPLPDLARIDPEAAEAIAEARQEVLRKPRAASAWGRLGTVLWAHDYDSQAHFCLAQAERLDPREPRWPYLQGVKLLVTDPSAGIACLQRAVERCARDDPLAPRLRLAEALLDTGRLEEAEVHLQQALAHEPQNARTRLDLGRLNLLRGDWRTALDHLSVCVADEFARRPALRLRAQVYRRLGEREHAETDESRAAQLSEDERWPDPFVDEAYRWQRGLSVRLMTAGRLKRAGRLDEAIASLEETARKYPSSTLAHLQLAEIWQGLGRLDQAEQVCRQAVQHDPEAAQAWFWLGVFQSLRNRPREAAESLRRAIHLKPDHALAHFSLGHCLKQLDDPAAAAAEFRITLRCRPGYEPARTALKELEVGTQEKGKE